MRTLICSLALLAASIAGAATPTSTATSTPTPTATSTATPTPVSTSMVPVQLTAAQHAYMQGTILPAANAATCARYRLPVSCTTAQVVTAGCVASPFYLVTKVALSFVPCTIYTIDGAGEAAYAADSLYQKMTDAVTLDAATDLHSACLAWQSASQTTRDQVCTSMGRSAGCAAYPAVCP